MDKNSGIINTGNIGGNATVTHQTNYAPLPENDREELAHLENQLRNILSSVRDRNITDAEAINDSLQELMARISSDQPNSRSVQISAKGLVEASSAVEEVLPIAMRIVSIIGTMFGVST